MDERIVKIFKHPATIPTVIGVVAFSSGLGAGFLIGRKTKSEEYELPAQLEFDFNKSDLLAIEETPNFVITEEKQITLSGINTSNSSNDDDVEVNLTLPAIDSLGNMEETLQVAMMSHHTDIAPVKQNVFAGKSSEWDYEEELSSRATLKGNNPYVVHKDEFYSEESGFMQNTLCYYAGDDIMCDEEDVPIYNYASLTGPLLFGHGSDDENVVYIRNEKQKAEYEVLYHSGLFSVEVLGLQIEENERVKDLKHSAIRKLRPE